jgi:hypothetical protein
VRYICKFYLYIILAEKRRGKNRKYIILYFNNYKASDNLLYNIPVSRVIAFSWYFYYVNRLKAKNILSFQIKLTEPYLYRILSLNRYINKFFTVKKNRISYLYITGYKNIKKQSFYKEKS